MKRVLCPFCRDERDVIEVSENEVIEVRGENIEVMSHYVKCLECSNDFEDLSLDFDLLEEAYKVYRTIHKYIQPEEIKAFRTKLKITQVEFANLLGWGEVTISRYEQGALQDDAHDSALHAAMTREGFKSLLAKKSNVIPFKKMGRINEWLNEESLSLLKDLRKRIEHLEKMQVVQKAAKQSQRNINTWEKQRLMTGKSRVKGDVSLYISEPRQAYK